MVGLPYKYGAIVMNSDSNSNNVLEIILKGSKHRLNLFCHEEVQASAFRFIEIETRLPHPPFNASRMGQSGRLSPWQVFAKKFN